MSNSTNSPQKNTEAETVAMTPEEIESGLRNQIEFYFSKQNLVNDAYLLSQMDAQKYVSVQVIAGFPKVRKFTSDSDLLVRVMRECKNCEVDSEGSKVRPKIKRERNTLILRDISSETAKSDVESIFKFEGCPEPVNVKSEVGDCWFVTFKSEDDCTDTAMKLLGKQFQGKPIRARVKSENLLRGMLANATNNAPSKASTDGAPNQWQSPNGYYGNAPMYGGWNPAYPVMYQPYPNAVNMPHMNGAAPKGKRSGSSNGERRKGGAPAKEQFPNSSAAAAAAAEKKRNRKNNRKGKKGPNSSQPQLGPEHFPALPNAVVGQDSGYTGSFRKFSREQMATIINKTVGGEHVTIETLPIREQCVGIAEKPLTKSQLMEPFPIMYPASPSPMISPTPKIDPFRMPELDLNKPAAAQPTVAQIVAQSASKPVISLVHKAATPKKKSSGASSAVDSKENRKGAKEKNNSAGKKAAAAPTAAPVSAPATTSDAPASPAKPASSESDAAADAGKLSYAALLKKSAAK